jgi:hypothetical protein
MAPSVRSCKLDLFLHFDDAYASCTAWFSLSSPLGAWNIQIDRYGLCGFLYCFHIFCLLVSFDLNGDQLEV